jgi:two-component system sensor histidine kinase TctE
LGLNNSLWVNLLNKASLYGHDKAHILVSLVFSPMPILTLKDDSPGIPGSAEVGCGLELAIVKEIAHLHRTNLKI